MSFLTTHTTHTTHRSFDTSQAQAPSPLEAEGLISTLIDQGHWVLDGQGRPVSATPLRAGIRPGWGTIGKIDTVAKQRFVGMDALPRAFVCHSELMGLVAFKRTSADSGSLLTRGGENIISLTRPTYAIFNEQLRVVHQRSVDRKARYVEILPQVYPPQAWWASVLGLQPQRFRHTAELLNTALNFAVTVIYRFKQMFGCPRPVEYSAGIMPLVPTPGHDSWPSGHATESFLQARILTTLSDLSLGNAASAEDLLLQTAQGIAVNREIAGVHFPADSVAGSVLGDTMARFIMSYSADRTSPSGKQLAYRRNFDATAFYNSQTVRPTTEVNIATLMKAPDLLAAADAFDAQAPVDPDQAYMQWLWQAACDEWL